MMLQAPADAGWHAVERTRDALPELQAFYEANPGYWLMVHGVPPLPSEAETDFGSTPPADMHWRELHDWVIRDHATQRIVGEIGAASDLPAPGVMHLGFFIVEDARQGTGFAQDVYRCYEAWAIAQGARWLRLGVVERNERGRRFWERAGYQEVRRRPGVQIGELTHELIVMMKPVGLNTRTEYLQAVERDRPDAP